MRYADRIQAPAQPGKYFFLIVFFSLLFALSAFSQSKEEKKMRIKAVKALNAGNYSEAEELYMDLLKLNPANPDYNYEMGLAIFEGGIYRGKSARYFERAIANTKSDSLPDMFLYAGRAEQHAGNFDLAIDYYNTYRGLLRKAGTDLNSIEFDISRAIEMCKNGKVQFENNKDHIKIENMGERINSKYADYSPVVTSDESMILFTSRRSNSTGQNIANDQKYYEDIYYSINIDGQWTLASNLDSSNEYMSNQLNTETHDATITFAGDETQLYIYRDLDVWISTKTNGQWGAPVKASGNINSTRGFEPSVFITQDEKIMFVVSDIGSGYGGRDIYISKKQDNGNWGTLKNLGKGINTKFDEDAPFLTPDGNTLYFASNGHNSMGDYDIFKSVIDENGNFSAPENLGPPINTPGHDRYFVTTDNGAIGYYASDREGGFGETDIYRIILDCKSVSATIIRGLVYSGDKHSPVYATIEIYNPETDELINTYIANKETGEYEMRLKTETTYKFIIRAEGYLPHDGEFTVPQQCDYYSLFQEIKIENLADSAGRIYAQRASINNAFFNVDKKIEERYASISPSALDETQKDSLRSLVAQEFHPVEITNYIQMLDILDPKGSKLASKVIGAENVAMIQTRDVIYKGYSEQIVSADGLFYKDLLPEARAEYLVASAIRPEEAYPKQQVKIIDEKLKDAPFESLLASLPEVDESTMINEPLIAMKPTAEQLSMATIKGLIAAEASPIAAVIKVYDLKSGILVGTYNSDSENGGYEMQLKTGNDYKYTIEAPGYTLQDGEFSIPVQTELYDLHQEIQLTKLTNEQNAVFGQKTIVNNAFFNADQEIINRYPNLDFLSLSVAQIDSLRFLITRNTDPIEITKFVKTMDVIDANGASLAHVSIGIYEVEDGQFLFGEKARYQQTIDTADQNFDENRLPEARAGYVIAAEMKPEDNYPTSRINEIDKKLADQPLMAYLATLPEVDNSKMITEATLAAKPTAEQLAMAKIEGLLIADGKPSSAVIKVFDVKTGILIKTVNAISGAYEFNLKTGNEYRYTVEIPGYSIQDGTFKVPVQTELYSLHQEINVEKMVDSKDRVYAQKTTVNNAFFNADEEIIKRYPNLDFLSLSTTQIDSLRSLITASTDPIEITKFVKTVDILDPNGTSLANTSIGIYEVQDGSFIYNEEKAYNKMMTEADSNLAANRMPEARAGYLVASEIKPEEKSPVEKAQNIEKKLADKPFEALLATLPEVDNSKMLVPADMKQEVAENIAPKAENIKTDEAENTTTESAQKSETATSEASQNTNAEAKETSAEVIAKTTPAPAKIKDKIASEQTEKVENASTVAESSSKSNTSSGAEKVVFRNILFDFDKADLRAESITELQRVSSYLRTSPAVDLRIDGHADWIGSIEYNLALSERRAQRAYYFIISEGISDKRLTYQYFGESLPIAPNANADGTDNPEGRQLNRRVEFKLDETGTADNVILKF